MQHPIVLVGWLSVSESVSAVVGVVITIVQTHFFIILKVTAFVKYGLLLGFKNVTNVKNTI